MKTPEQLAVEWLKEEYGDTSNWTYMGQEMSLDAFYAGYQAAKDKYKVAIDTYEDVAKQMLEEAVRIMSPKDQVADAGKVMNSPEKQDSCEHILDMEKMVDVNSSSGWISVKDRLPETNELCIVYTEFRAIVPALYGNESWIFDEGQGWLEKALSYVSHWMPMPKPPEGK